MTYFFSMNVCQCIPWDMIRPNRTENMHICDRFSNDCFHSKMKNFTYAKKSCHCIPTCNTIHFTYAIEKSPLHIHEICQQFRYIGSRKTFQQLKLKDWKLFLNMTTSKRAYRHFLKSRNQSSIEKFSKDIQVGNIGNNNADDDLEDEDDEADSGTLFNHEICHRLFSKDVSIFEIQLVDQSYKKMIQSLRITFADQLGSIGGTLGLFCGFSFLAVVEMIHWMWIGMFKIINQRSSVKMSKH